MAPRAESTLAASTRLTSARLGAVRLVLLSRAGVFANGRAYTKKPHTRWGFFVLNPDDDLLSHGEAPHYHRR